MPGDRFKQIRAVLKLSPTYDLDFAKVDPLHNVWIIMKHFLRECTKRAVRAGILSFDECTAWCKGRTAAKTCMKMKQARAVQNQFLCFCSLGDRIRFQSVGHGLGEEGRYSHSTRIHKRFPRAPFPHVFRKLHTPLNSKLDDAFIAPSTPSAFWAIQMAHPTKVPPSINRQIIVTDNFYTGNSNALQLRHITDVEVHVLGTVQLNNMDVVNRLSLKEAVKQLENAPQEDWRLFQSCLSSTERCSRT